MNLNPCTDLNSIHKISQIFVNKKKMETDDVIVSPPQKTNTYKELFGLAGNLGIIWVCRPRRPGLMMPMAVGSVLHKSKCQLTTQTPYGAHFSAHL